MVVMSCEDYVTKVMKHLNNEEHYKKLQEDLTGLFSQHIKSYLLEMKSRHSIDEDTFSVFYRKTSGLPGFIFFQRFISRECRVD